MEKDKKTEKGQEKKPVISYHTFMFPFLYATDKVTRKEFGSRCHAGWQADIWNPETMKGSDYYNQYHYFNETAHNAIYTTGKSKKGKKDNPYENFENEAVINLRFDLSSLIMEQEAGGSDERKSDLFEYVIRKYKDRKPGKEFEYALDIRAIRMKLYNTGVGILIFELENRKYSAEQDIIQINDFGRRVYAPYYGYYNNDIHCSICADEVFFRINGKNRENCNLLSETLTTSAEKTILAEPIRTILSNGTYSVTAKNTPSDHETRIETVIDDRMFVVCYYKNGDFVDAMREWDGDHYRYMTHAKEMPPFNNEGNGNTAHRLYTMMYVDGDGICCHGRDMMQKLLSDEHIYTRWLEYYYDDEKEFRGTITGFSEYTMISVAKKPADYLITPFLTQYVEMAALVLAQRASLLSFEYMISECVRENKCYSADDIQKKYTLFQSQIFLKEISSQQQAIEIYNMLEKNLMVDKIHNDIKEQIRDLFDQKNFEHDSKENRILFWLSLLSIVEAADVLTNLFFLESDVSWKFIFSALDASAPIWSKLVVMIAFGAAIGISYKRKK